MLVEFFFDLILAPQGSPMGTGVCLWAVILMTKIRKSGVMVSVAVLQYLIVFVKLHETEWSSDCH